MPEIFIRGFEPCDRSSVRRISCETAFLGADRRLFIDDDELLADALTLYYTDHEPGACFVAVDGERVAGYIIGTKDVLRMEKVFSSKILPGLIGKAFRRGVFWKKGIWQFFCHVAQSALMGEFYTPHFGARYPAMLHINIDKEYRGQQLGRKLVDHYKGFLKKQGVRGVHFGSMSEEAKGFFLSTGFELLYTSRRSYLKYRIGKIVPFYILGKALI